MAEGFRRRVANQQTTAQRLDGIMRSARRIMRKDKGLSTDLDRLPMLTWIMFLKFLDDMERVEEVNAQLGCTEYEPVIDPPYRWRDWAAQPDGLTGSDLLAFLANDEAEGPDGTKGPGLFAYLKGLRGGSDGAGRRDVISTVFQGFSNRMESGYLLRDVVNLIDGIHFHVSEEVHTLGRLYETLLREMRDAAGQNGEFYTPRPVVRFMVEVTDPRLGEVVLDPASGTGGFLTEAFAHLMRQTKAEADGVTVQERSIRGGEAKALPYLLGQLNLLLHGVRVPHIEWGNALRHRLSEIGADQRVDVILTNPPFGGEEEVGILNNFPDDRRTTETALLFLQLVMRRLKREGRGRAAVVVPNGTLFGDGIGARVKAEMLEQFNVHTIVRLPEGVFSPYTDIPANLIFFDTSGPTRSIWYYEQPKPEGRRKYSKTAPMVYEEFTECLAWWMDRKANDHAWLVDAAGLVQRDEKGRVIGCNLDVKNPRPEGVEIRSPGELVEAIVVRQRRVLRVIEEVEADVGDSAMTSRPVPLREFLRKSDNWVELDPDAIYKQVTVRLWGKGLKLRRVVAGSEIAARRQVQVRVGQFLLSRIDARNGAFGLVPPELDGALVSGDFPAFDVDCAQADPRYLEWYSRTNGFVDLCRRASEGSTNRVRLKEERLLEMEIPLPPPEEQREVVARLDRIAGLAETSRETARDLEALIVAMQHRVFN